MAQNSDTMHFKTDPDTVALLEALDDFAKKRFHEDDVKLGPGQYPFKSAILRKSLRIAAPAIRSGLEREGVEFLYS